MKTNASASKEYQDLEKRVKKLERLVGTLGDTPPAQAALEDTTLAGQPIGRIVENNINDIKNIEAALQGDTDNTPGGNRGQMLPIHRMYADLRTGAGKLLSSTEKRSARLFGLFVERVVEAEANKLDASGQTYSLTSAGAEEVLLGKHDPDASNLLQGVKEESRSQIVARAMRNVVQLSKIDDCECEEIDGCEHSIIQFRSGRPNALAAPKQSFREIMQSVYNESSDNIY